MCVCVCVCVCVVFSLRVSGQNTVFQNYWLRYFLPQSFQWLRVIICITIKFTSSCSDSILDLSHTWQNLNRLLIFRVREVLSQGEKTATLSQGCPLWVLINPTLISFSLPPLSPRPRPHPDPCISRSPLLSCTLFNLLSQAPLVVGPQDMFDTEPCSLVSLTGS